jgi:hypothetical protein
MLDWEVYFLNLINSGYEYPEAEYRTLNKFPLVTSEDIENFYDSI